VFQKGNNGEGINRQMYFEVANPVKYIIIYQNVYYSILPGVSMSGIPIPAAIPPTIDPGGINHGKIE